MLTLATLGLLAYGVYEMTWPVIDLIRGPRLELWAELGSVGFGLLLSLSAAFVRVRMPGGMLLALGAMLGLQALAVHAAAHFETGIPPQVLRAVLAVALLVLAEVGSQMPERAETERTPEESSRGGRTRTGGG